MGWYPTDPGMECWDTKNRIKVATIPIITAIL